MRQYLKQKVILQGVEYRMQRQERVSKGVDLAERADAVKKPVPDWVYYGAGSKTTKRNADADPEAADAVKKPVPD